MADWAEKAQAFRALHVKGDPLVLVNVWDAGSAKTVAETGAKALATASWSVAAAHGFADGEALPFDLALANAARIAAAVTQPVTMDLEGGYSATAEGVGENVARAKEAGVVGINLEDGRGPGAPLRDTSEMVARIAAARAAAGPDLFINARIDAFLWSEAAAHGGLLPDVIMRGRAYAVAGADGLFLPGLMDDALIRAACEALPRPVNLMARADAPDRARYAALGAARISLGPSPWRAAMETLKGVAEAWR